MKINIKQLKINILINKNKLVDNQQPRIKNNKKKHLIHVYLRYLYIKFEIKNKNNQMELKNEIIILT